MTLVEFNVTLKGMVMIEHFVTDTPSLHLLAVIQMLPFGSA